MYSILLTPSLFTALLLETNLLFLCFTIAQMSSVFERLDCSATGNDRLSA